MKLSKRLVKVQKKPINSINTKGDRNKNQNYFEINSQFSLFSLISIIYFLTTLSLMVMNINLVIKLGLFTTLIWIFYVNISKHLLSIKKFSLDSKGKISIIENEKIIYTSDLILAQLFISTWLIILVFTNQQNKKEYLPIFVTSISNNQFNKINSQLKGIELSRA